MSIGSAEGYDRTLQIGDPADVIIFDTISNNDCEYGLSLIDGATGLAADPNIFTIVQPTFATSFESPYIVSPD